MLDGCTRMVLSLRTLTNKLPRTIYLQVISATFEPPLQLLPLLPLLPLATEPRPGRALQVFLRMAIRYGLPDQLITDKGREWALAVFVCYAMERLHNPRPAAGGGPRARRAYRAWCRAWRQRRRPHRYVKSKRNVRRLPAHTVFHIVYHASSGVTQVVVERFNYEINIRVLIPVREALFRLESLQLLDKTRETHVGAVQFVTLPLMQYGCDLLRLSWNEHKRRRIRGVVGSGGRPEALRRSHPHPGGQRQLLPGFDAVAEYEQASGKALRRVPRTAALRDRCFYRRARARRRARGRLMAYELSTTAHSPTTRHPTAH